MQAAHKTREKNEDLARVPSHETCARGFAKEQCDGGVEEIRLSER